MPAMAAPVRRCSPWRRSIRCACTSTCRRSYASQVKIGDTVTVTLAERAGEQYRGTVARTARAIDTATRTMQVEIRVPNPDGALIAGSYVQAMLPINVDAAAPWSCPPMCCCSGPTARASRWWTRAGDVHLALVKLGTDFGTTVEVLSGLKRQRSGHGESGGFARRRRCGDAAAHAAEGRLADARCGPIPALRLGWQCSRDRGRCSRCAARLRGGSRLSPAAGRGAAGLAAGGAVARGGAERRCAEGRLVAAVPGRRARIRWWSARSPAIRICAWRPRGSIRHALR